MQNAHQRGQQGVADPWIGGASQGLPHHRRIIDCVVPDSHHRPAVQHQSGRMYSPPAPCERTALTSGYDLGLTMQTIRLLVLFLRSLLVAMMMMRKTMYDMLLAI